MCGGSETFGVDRLSDAFVRQGAVFITAFIRTSRTGAITASTSRPARPSPSGSAAYGIASSAHRLEHRAGIVVLAILVVHIVALNGQKRIGETMCEYYEEVRQWE
jgi:hypothetical protein